MEIELRKFQSIGQDRSDSMLDKLTDEQKEKLADLCEQINNIFTEEENGFAEDNIDEYYRSSLYKGISDVMYELKKWC